MSYENKEYILQFFEGVHEKEGRTELIEVYRKAKSWDRLKPMLNKSLHKYRVVNESSGTPQYFINLGATGAYSEVLELIKEYESGEYND